MGCLREDLKALGAFMKENLLKSQQNWEGAYNKGARLQEFQSGDRVVVLLPTSESELLPRWKGPLEVMK